MASSNKTKSVRSGLIKKGRQFQNHHRKEYSGEKLSLKKMPSDPMKYLLAWYRAAERAGIAEPNAVALATSTKSGIPSCRYVLVKGFEPDGVVFFTNYKSRKGAELQKNPNAAITFYWAKFSRQVRIEGRVERVSESHSDKYFASRPRGSQIAASVSPQSSEIPNIEWLEEKFTELSSSSDYDIVRPAHWGGYKLIPSRIEFWQGQENRLHHRVVYEKKNKITSGSWSKRVLAP
jgi:pyridoxamine 5'-phosphate oxidase